MINNNIILKPKICLGLLLIIFNLSYCEYRFNNYSLKNGLPSNQVFCTFRDSHGFLWVSTEIALVRFDGTKFNTFKGKNISVSNEQIASIHEISYNKILFISLSAQIHIYDYETGVCKNISSQIPLLKNTGIYDFYISKDGSYWLFTINGLIKTDCDFRNFKSFEIKDNVKGHPTGNKINAIFEDKNGIFWLGMFHRGLMKFNPRNGIYSSKEFENILPAIQVRTIEGIKNSDFIYVGTHGKGLLRLNIQNLETKFYTSIRKGNIIQYGYLPDNSINSLKFQNDSILWIGSFMGLGRLNINSGYCESFLNNINDINSIPNNNIQNIFLDKQSILWISTYGGLSNTHLSGRRFIKYSVNPADINSVSTNNVNCFWEDSENRMWICGVEGIDIYKNGKKLYNYKLPKSRDGIQRNEIVCIMHDTNNTYWLGVWGGGIFRFTLNKNFIPGDFLNFTSFYSDTSNLSTPGSNYLRKIFKSQNGDILIGTWNGGLSVISNSEKLKNKIKFTRINRSQDPSKGLASDFVADMVMDKQNYLWLITGNGFQRINFNKNSYKLFIPFPSEPENKLNSPVTLMKAKDNSIWLGTFGGLIRIYDIKQDKFKYEIVLKDNTRGVYGILEDPITGNIWFSTINSEIGCYSIREKKIKLYSMVYEVDGFDFYFGYPFRDSKGNFYFNGKSGYLKFNPSKISENRDKPAVYISSLKVSGTDYETFSDLCTIKEIVLNHDDNDISFRVAAMNFINPELNKFKYLLEGFSKDWTEIEENGNLRFARIPSGEYKLKIIAANNDGIWNNSGLLITLIVKPPFWATAYFRIIMFVLLGSVIYLYFNSKIKQLKKEREQQNLLSRLLIESQELERKRLSKELHDGLGQNLLITKNWLNLYRNSESKDHEDLVKIEEIIKDSITEVKKISSNLHPHQLERLGLNKTIKSMIRNISESTQLKINDEIDEISGVLSAEQEINLYRIIQESLNNIIKHSGSKEAKIKIQKKEKEIVVAIEDFGVGFNIADKEISERISEGLGLKSLKERARLLNSELFIESRRNQGTKILLTIRY